MTLEDRIEGRDNNFNFIRMVAAIAVIFSHSFILARGPLNGSDPLVKYLGFPISGIAVDVFFIASGLLITKSLIEGDSLIGFVKARVLRIFPGLIAAVLFCVLFVGVYATTLEPSEYLLHSDTLSFIQRNVWLFDNVIQYSLPGVFSSNPYPHAVNGSLWTLPWEVYSYLSVFALYFVFRSKCEISIVIACLSLYVLYCNNVFNFVEFNFLNPVYIKLLLMFFIGSLFYVLKNKLKLSVLLSLFFVVLYSYFSGSDFGQIIYPIMLSYVMIVFAYIPKGFLLKYNKLGDYSYGTYIYAFPIQQLLVYVFKFDGWQLFIYSTVLTIPIAFLSWEFVEKPSLKLKNRT